MTGLRSLVLVQVTVGKDIEASFSSSRLSQLEETFNLDIVDPLASIFVFALCHTPDTSAEQSNAGSADVGSVTDLRFGY